MTHAFQRRWLVFAALLACIAAPLAAFAQDKAPAAGSLLVFAASSLTEALNDVGDAYAAHGHAKPRFSYAASSALARQIENGAPAAMFIAADEQWMDYLAQRKLIVPDSRTSFLGNTLVLIAPADRPLHVKMGFNFPLAKALAGGKLSMGDPDSVPVGKYGKTALENLGVWDEVAPSVIRADNVRVALSFVERGEAAAGIVYATDAALAKNVTVVSAFPEASYPPVTYPLAVIAAHDTPEAEAFRAFLLGPDARAIFTKYGFTQP